MAHPEMQVKQISAYTQSCCSSNPTLLQNAGLGSRSPRGGSSPDNYAVAAVVASKQSACPLQLWLVPIAGHRAPQTPSYNGSIVMERQLPSPATSVLATPSPKQRFAQSNFQGVRSVDAPASPQCDLDRVTIFQNAILIHQKRLKISNSQLFQTLITIDPLISEYYAAMEMAKANGFKAGPEAAKARKQKRMDIIQAIERYDSLLEERRQILQTQDTSLQSAFETKELSGTDKMLEALDIQIAAAEDLAERMAAREAKKEWKTFKAVPWC